MVIDWRRVAFFAAAVRDFVPGPGTVTREQLIERLTECAGCRWRRGQVCDPMDCGCKVAGIAVGVSARCPVGRWDKEKAPEV